MNRVQEFLKPDNQTPIDEIEVVKMNNVVNKRMDDIVTQINSLTLEKINAQNRIKELEVAIAELKLEYHVFESFNNRDIVTTTNNTNINININSDHRVDGRVKHDRLHIEDCLKEIMKDAGRPLEIGVIIRRMKKFGHPWSYNTAYKYITGTGVIEPAGKRGFYQLVK